jgi:hypothetical protein
MMGCFASDVCDFQPLVNLNNFSASMLDDDQQLVQYTNRSIAFLPLLTCFLSACAPEKYPDLEPLTIDVTHIQSIFIQVDYGEVTLLASDDSRASIMGRCCLPKNWRIK